MTNLPDGLNGAVWGRRGTVLSLAQAESLVKRLGRINPDIVLAASAGRDVVLDCHLEGSADGRLDVGWLTGIVGGIPFNIHNRSAVAEPGFLCIRLASGWGSRSLDGDEAEVELVTLARPAAADLPIARLTGSPAVPDEFFWPPLAHALADARSARALARLRDATSDLVPATTFAGPVVQWPIVLNAVLSAARARGPAGTDAALLAEAWHAERVDDAARALLQALETQAGLPNEYTDQHGSRWVRHRWLSPAADAPAKGVDEAAGWALIVRPRVGAQMPRTMSILDSSGARERVLNLTDWTVRFARVSGAAVSIDEEDKGDLLAAVYRRVDPKHS